jgi:16S rRNA U1498 N3-methylase RsmE
MESKLVVIPANELVVLIETALEKVEIKRVEKEESKTQSEKLYTINQVAKRLNRAHATIKKLVEQGVLSATVDGLISEKSINNYLRNV